MPFSDPSFDDDYEALRQRILQRQQARYLADNQNDGTDAILPVMAGGLDMLKGQSAAQLDPVATATGLNINKYQGTPISPIIKEALLNRQTKSRQEALDDQSMLKGIEDIRQKRADSRLKGQMADSNLALAYAKLATEVGQKEADRQLKKFLQENGFDQQENILSKTQAFTGEENQKNRDSALERTKISANAKTKSAGQPKEYQFKAAHFGKTMVNASDVLDQLEKQGAPLTDQTAYSTGQLKSILPFGIGEGMLPEWQKEQKQAELSFINAILRRESGAAVPEQEYTRYRKQYFAVPGDTPDVLAQKRQNRLQAIENLKAESGPAWAAGAMISRPAPLGPKSKGISKEEAVAELKRRGRIK